MRELATLNRTRLDYLERFQQLIAAYNSGAYNVEAMFAELMRFAEALNAEERRHMTENLTEEDLALFDLSTRNANGSTSISMTLMPVRGGVCMQQFNKFQETQQCA